MDKYTFEQWCTHAVCEIAFPPDRKRVSQELLDHMNDHCDDLIAQGYPADDAKKLTIDAMGNADEIAWQLAAIHRPFWGYLLRASRILLIALLLITVIPFSLFISNPKYSEPPAGRFDPYTLTYICDETGSTTPILITAPKRSVSCNGYTIRVSKAVWTHTEHPSSQYSNSDHFNFQIEVTSLLPWAQSPDILHCLWAQDSEGNIYSPMFSGTPTGLRGTVYRTGIRTWVLDMAITNFSSQNAQWIEIRYTREGNDIAFRIDLPGGGEQ